MSEIKPFTGVDDRVHLADCVPLDTPFTLNVFPSNICNFKCSYCAQSLGKDVMLNEYGLNSEIMSLDTAARIAEQSAKFGRKYKLISMMGHGEPLCNKNLPQIISLLKNADIADRIDIISNASLLTHELSDRLLNAGLDILRVSLQGISTESYKRTSGVNIDFNSFYENLQYFHNQAKKCGAKLFVKTMDVSLQTGEDEKFFEMFGTITDRMFIDKVKPVYDKVSYTDAQNDISTDRYGNKHDHRIVCPQPFYMMSVWANGDVTPCDALYKACILGNIHTDTLTDMWQGYTHRDFCKAQLSGGRFADKSCSRCCAPDDVAHKEDILDDQRENLLKKWRGNDD